MSGTCSLRTYQYKNAIKNSFIFFDTQAVTTQDIHFKNMVDALN